jgi:hypothetical protein
MAGRGTRLPEELTVISESACLRSRRPSGPQADRVQLETTVPPALERGSTVDAVGRLSFSFLCLS